MTVRPSEWEGVLTRFPSAQITDRADGSALVCLPDAPLPSGWSKSVTTVWFVVPVGYPAAQPDCFWVDEDVRLAGDALPVNSGAQPIGGTGPVGLWFSWHLPAWQPSRDGLGTFVRFIEARFRDAH